MPETGECASSPIGSALSLCAGHQFLGARNELPRDRIVGIVGVDQGGDVRRHGNGIARRDLFQVGKICDGGQAVGNQLDGIAQRRGRLETDRALVEIGIGHASPAGGVHTT